jgi:hypothetical protein
MKVLTAHAAAGSFPIEHRTFTPQPAQFFRVGDWFRLPTATVEIRRNGTYVRTARVEEASPDCRMLWLSPEDVDSRVLIDKFDGYEVWIDPDRLGTSRLGSRCQGTSLGSSFPREHFIADRKLDELLNSPSAQEVGRRPSIGWFGKAGHG